MDNTDSPHRFAAMIIFPFRAKIINEILFEIRVKNNYISGSFFFLFEKTNNIDLSEIEARYN